MHGTEPQHTDIDTKRSRRTTPTYDLKTDTYYVTYDPDGDRSLSTTILLAMMEIERSSVADLEPIRDVINVDSADDLFVSDSESTSQLEFTYNRYDITVRNDGLITFEPDFDAL
ncbi:MAG: HalOD1 output domain-containing protein [Halobacteriota archaeon]